MPDDYNSPPIILKYQFIKLKLALLCGCVCPRVLSKYFGYQDTTLANMKYLDPVQVSSGNLCWSL